MLHWFEKCLGWSPDSIRKRLEKCLGWSPDSVRKRFEKCLVWSLDSVTKALKGNQWFDSVFRARVGRATAEHPQVPGGSRSEVCQVRSSALHTLPYSPFYFWPTLSLQIPRARLSTVGSLRLFCLQSLCTEWPSPSSLTETISWLLSVKH